MWRGNISLFSSLKEKLTSILKIVLSLKQMFLIAATFLLNFELCFCACAQTEYEINGECYPMCAPGSHVYIYCTEFGSTICVPCIDSTFTSEPNCLLNCLSCAVCNIGQGIRVKTACTQTSDTVCEPLEGFYCIHYDKGSCTQAVEHTKCNPGQYIKQKGTARKDAECAGCKNGTYFDGSLEICKQHTKCEDLGLTEIKPGTTMSDTECGYKIQGALIAGPIVCIVVVVILLKIRHMIGRCAGNLYLTDIISTRQMPLNGESSCPVFSTEQKIRTHSPPCQGEFTVLTGNLESSYNKGRNSKCQRPCYRDCDGLGEWLHPCWMSLHSPETQSFTESLPGASSHKYPSRNKGDMNALSSS